jgi:hypothetical protein
MGFEEREKELKAYHLKQREYELQVQQQEQQRLSNLASKAALKVNYNYTEEEFQSALYKLTEAAWKYDKHSAGAPSLDAFDQESMEAHIFKEQLRAAFYMKITPQELGAIMHYFDKVIYLYIIKYNIISILDGVENKRPENLSCLIPCILLYILGLYINY